MSVFPPEWLDEVELRIPRIPRPPRSRIGRQRRTAWVEGAPEPGVLTTVTIVIAGECPDEGEWRKIIQAARAKWQRPSLFGSARSRRQRSPRHAVLDEILTILTAHGPRPPQREGLMKYWKAVQQDANVACERNGLAGWKDWRDLRRFVVRHEQVMARLETQCTS